MVHVQNVTFFQFQHQRDSFNSFSSKSLVHGIETSVSGDGLLWTFVHLLHCFQIFAMATTSIECSVPGCSFRTPRLPERFYPNMVDQLKVQFVFFVVDNIVGIVCIVDIVDFVGIGSPWLPKLV